jgi:hypothetical protein
MPYGPIIITARRRLAACPHLPQTLLLKRRIAAGQLGVEAGADLEQAADAAEQLDAAAGRLGDARQDLEECALAGPLRPMMPTTSPRCTSKETSFKAHMVSCSVVG